jgi:iron complex transport system ATP-binding protein
VGNHEKKKPENGILMETSPLQLSDLHIGYSQGKGGEHLVAGPINNRLITGQLHCLLGPNGAGKSTLLKTIAGIQRPLKGDVRVYGQKLAQMSRPALAKILSVVLSDRINHGNLTVYQLVSLGRTPHTGWFGRLSSADREKIDWAIENTHVSDLASKSIHEISDGERQKTMIARALAQDTPVVLLDEPTAFLDLPNRIEIIRLLKNLAHRTGKAVVMSTHELDLALQAADEIWLMTIDNQLHTGIPEELVLKDIFGQVFTKKGVVFDKRHGVFKVTEPHNAEISVTGDEPGSFWTQRALERMGYRVLTGNTDLPNIYVAKNQQEWQWTYQDSEDAVEFSSIAALTAHLKGGDK